MLQVTALNDSPGPYKHTNNDVFDDFPKIFDHFPKISQNRSEGQTNTSKHFLNISENFLKITEDCQRQLKKIRRCFDHTSTNLSAVKGTKKKCYQKGIIFHSVKDKNSIFTVHHEEITF